MGGTVISLKIENYKMLNLNLVYMMERNIITKKWKNSGNIWEICGWYMIFQRYNFEKFRGAIISPQIEKSKIENGESICILNTHIITKNETILSIFRKVIIKIRYAHAENFEKRGRRNFPQNWKFKNLKCYFGICVGNKHYMQKWSNSVNI